MKIRFDFISNSSSSSFICTREDLNTIAVHGDVNSISLKKFLQDNWRLDVWGFFEDPKASTVRFVSDEMFSKHFGSGPYRSLPKSIEHLIERYEMAYANAMNDHTNERNAKWKNVKCIEGDIVDALCKVLEPEWKDVDLIEVYASDEPKDDGECNDEEFMHDSFACLQNPKFYRIYNKH